MKQGKLLSSLTVRRNFQKKIWKPAIWIFSVQPPQVVPQQSYTLWKHCAPLWDGNSWHMPGCKVAQHASCLPPLYSESLWSLVHQNMSRQQDTDRCTRKRTPWHFPWVPSSSRGNKNWHGDTFFEERLCLSDLNQQERDSGSQHAVVGDSTVFPQVLLKGKRMV